MYRMWLAAAGTMFFLVACTETREVRYVPYENKSYVSGRKADTQTSRAYKSQYKRSTGRYSCGTLYSVYEKCYAIGISNTIDYCADVTEALYYELNLNDRDSEAAVSLFCGIACTTGAQRSGMMSYASFNGEYCG